MAPRLLTMLLFSMCAVGPARPGTLVIVGGALSADNGEVYRSFVGALPEPATDRIAVIPAASGEPAQSAQSVAGVLTRYGVCSDRIDVIQLALKDDDSTPDVDESEWRDNADDQAEIAKIRAAGGIWITGGDQRRLTGLLARGRSDDSPMLAAIRERLAAGAVVGGTSAGAAVMSDPMITGGDPLASLVRRGGEAIDDGLALGRGLGFLSGALVDQHFGARARLGRLTMAVAALPEDQRLGLGVDENTAMIVSLAEGELRVAGAGNVTVVDGRKARFSTIEGQFAAFDVSLTVLSPGDRYRLEDGELTADPSRNPTVGKEHYDSPGSDGGGMAVPQPRLSRLLGTELLDNKGSRTLNRVSFDADGRGVLFRFQQDDRSSGFWGYDGGGQSRYTVGGVRFDVLPVSVSVEPLLPQTED